MRRKISLAHFFSFSDCIPFITKNTNTRTHAYIPLRTNTFTQAYTVRVVLHARMHLTIIIVCDGSFVPMLRHSSELKGDEYHHHFFWRYLVYLMRRNDLNFIHIFDKIKSINNFYDCDCLQIVFLFQFVA